jgi:hypothetical protein
VLLTPGFIVSDGVHCHDNGDSPLGDEWLLSDCSENWFCSIILWNSVQFSLCFFFLLYTLENLCCLITMLTDSFASSGLVSSFSDFHFNSKVVDWEHGIDMAPSGCLVVPLAALGLWLWGLLGHWCVCHHSGEPGRAAGRTMDDRILSSMVSSCYIFKQNGKAWLNEKKITRLMLEK